jgi:protein involved in polysaccharide export with SLBB domain
MEKQELKVHEWLAVVFIVGLLGMLTAVTLISRTPAVPVLDQPHYVVDPVVVVRVEGAVERPGAVAVKKGSTVEEAIKQAKALPEADLSKVKLQKKVRKEQVIFVPSATHIEVKIAGVGKMKVTRGTRFNELKRILANAELYEETQFKSKRLLKEGETIYLKLRLKAP